MKILNLRITKKAAHKVILSILSYKVKILEMPLKDSHHMKEKLSWWKKK